MNRYCRWDLALFSTRLIIESKAIPKPRQFALGNAGAVVAASALALFAGTGLVLAGLAEAGVRGLNKSPACSCVSITLPASLNTRMTAACERRENFAYLIALQIAFGPGYHSGLNGNASEIRSTPL